MDENQKKNLEKIIKALNELDPETRENLEGNFEELLKLGIFDDVTEDHDNSNVKTLESMQLVDDAFKCESLEETKKMLNKALELDSDNVHAYLGFAAIAKNESKAVKWYKKAIEVGKNLIFSDFDELKGNFWHAMETRPYLIAKKEFADFYFYSFKFKKATEIYNEIMELNPNDNLGVRYRAAACLLIEEKLEEYYELYKEYETDSTANWKFTYALYLFKKQGKSDEAYKALASANKANPYVIRCLTRKEELPDTAPEAYEIGEKSEAVNFIYEVGIAWVVTEGTKEWVAEFYDIN